MLMEVEGVIVVNTKEISYVSTSSVTQIPRMLSICAVMNILYEVYIPRFYCELLLKKIVKLADESMTVVLIG